MKEFAYGGHGKVNGAFLAANLSAFGPYGERGEEILRKRLGVEELRCGTDDWYSLRLFLEVLGNFQNRFGRELMKKIGEGVLVGATLPPAMDSIQKAMSTLNEAYYMNHRAKPGEIGGYRWRAVSDRSGEMTCDSPYPCALDMGILDFLSRNFTPNAKVTHDDDTVCRYRGGEACRYIIEW